MVPEGVLESQQSRSNLDQDWLRGMGIRRYARITASLSTKSEFGHIPASTAESQDLRSNLDQNWLGSTSIYYQQVR